MMTVKELRERLEKFDDNQLVAIEVDNFTELADSIDKIYMRIDRKGQEVVVIW